jgi:ornithine cyclodeaminase/alanine dehydrogenase-like protein (mu-crystallin family)
MNPPRNSTLLLSRSEVRSLLTFEELFPAMREVFRRHGAGETLGAGLLHGNGVDGEFHIKAGGLLGGQPRYALKANGGFFHNRERFGMPNIQGAILLFDATNGYPLALMDSSEITGQRTAATTALAASLLARPDSRIATVIGAGRQGCLHLEALARVLRLESAFLADQDPSRAEKAARALSASLGIPVRPAPDPAAAVRASDVVVTCTPARSPVVAGGDVRCGTFVAAVGADSPAKHEIDPALFPRATVVVDVLEQCLAVGDLHHAIAAGVFTREAVHAELGEIVAGLNFRPLRLNSSSALSSALSARRAQRLLQLRRPRHPPPPLMPRPA